MNDVFCCPVYCVSVFNGRFGCACGCVVGAGSDQKNRGRSVTGLQSVFVVLVVHFFFELELVDELL